MTTKSRSALTVVALFALGLFSITTGGVQGTNYLLFCILAERLSR
jgi:hypothetical protein